MNTLGFVIRRIARSFGIKNELNRRMAITREMQFLAEAEAILGRAAWKDSENIQEVAEEYYQVQQLESQSEKLRVEIAKLEVENERLLIQQENLESSLENRINTLTQEKSTTMQKAIALLNDIENLKIDAEITRKKYSGMKMRLKSFVETGADPEEIEEVTAKLAQLKEEYGDETNLMIEKQVGVRSCEAKVAELEKRVAATREEARQKITALMNEVGRSSNLVARCGAKLGAVEKKISDLTFEVGTFLSNNADNPTPEIKRVVQKHRGIVSRLNTLKTSIRYNRILSGQQV